MSARATDRVLGTAVVFVWLTALLLAAAYATDRYAIGSEPVSASTPAVSGRAPASAVSGRMPDSSGQAQAASSHAPTVSGPTDAAADPETASNRTLAVAAGGDVLGDRKVASFIDERGGEAVFAAVAPVLTEADVTIVNLESPLSTLGSPAPDKDVVFRGHPALVDGLASAGIDVAGLANNHALDYGADALADTMARLKGAGIATAGAGPNAESAGRPAVLQTDGGTVAVLAYSHVLPAGFVATATRAGVNPSRPDTDRMLADIRTAADETDWVVVTIHWGVEYEQAPTAEQRHLAHAMADAGADLVLGHHPHVLQGIERYGTSLIAYSLGGLVFDHYSTETGESVILTATLSRGTPPSAALVPVYLSDSNGTPAPAEPETARRIRERLVAASHALDTKLTVDGDRLRLEP